MSRKVLIISLIILLLAGAAITLVMMSPKKARADYTYYIQVVRVIEGEEVPWANKNVRFLFTELEFYDRVTDQYGKAQVTVGDDGWVYWEAWILDPDPWIPDANPVISSSNYAKIVCRGNW